MPPLTAHFVTAQNHPFPRWLQAVLPEIGSNLVGKRVDSKSETLHYLKELGLSRTVVSGHADNGFLRHGVDQS